MELDDVGKYKLSASKKTYPMAKQVHRYRGNDGLFSHDLVTLADETCGGEPLMKCVVEQGKLVEPYPSLSRIRERCREQVDSLPSDLRGLEPQGKYRLEYSDELEAEAIRHGVRHA